MAVLSSLNAEILYWKDSSARIGMSKAKINLIINDYVQAKHPEKIVEYHSKLKKQRAKKLKKHIDKLYIYENLMWQDTQDNVDLEFSFLEAKIYCKQLKLATKSDWRLPTYSELLTLVDYFKYKPAAKKKIDFINSKKYWSINTTKSDVSINWYVDFKFGETGGTYRYNKANVRCVRNISQVEGEF